MGEKPVKSLVIGCGGSGIKTLIRLNELLAGNPEWRYRICNDVYYLVADTRNAELDAFDRKIDEQMGRTARPFISRIRLSEGFKILNEVIKPNFDDRPKGEEGKGLARLMENWWHDSDNQPFRAPLVFSLPDGAGQCPPASYGLAWWRMAEIERAIENIIEEMLKRGDADLNQFVNMNLIIVSGLAGGTGRGCWNLLTFKIRQFLQERYQVASSPVAVFFDATCFAEAMQENKNKRISMKVNALTGLSELSCWMRLSRGTLQYDYRLPNMKTPLRQGTDVLQTNVNVTRNQMDQTPVNNAYIICGSNGVAVLSDHDQYHEMAGAGLYAMITNSEISGDKVNETEPFLSLAAATFDVDSIHLRSYFENLARIAAVRGLIADDGAYKVENANGVSPLTEDLRRFFEKVPLLAGVSGAEALEPVQDGTFLQRVYHEIMKEVKGKLPNFIDALKRDSLDDAKDSSRSLCKPLETARIEAVFGQVFDALLKVVFKELQAKDLPDVIRKTMSGVYRGSGVRPSISRAQAFIAEMEAQLLRMHDALPDVVFIDNEAQRQNIDARKYLLSEVEKAYDRTFKEKVTGREHFNAEEKKDLEKKARAALLCVNWPLVRKALFAKLDEAVGTINALSGALAALASTLNVVVATFENARKASAGMDDGKDGEPHDELFVDDDPQKIFDSLVDSGDTSRFYKRILKPIMTRQEVLELASGSMLLAGEIHTEIEKALDTLIDARGNRKWGDDDRHSLRVRLTDVIRDQVQLKDTFLVEHFTFREVLKNNREKWNALIKRRQGNQEQREELFERFRRFLGVEPERDGEDGGRDYKLSRPEELIAKISISLVKSCLPWWKLAKDVNQEDLQTVMLFLPIDLKNKQNDFVGRLQKEVKSLKVSVLHEGNSNGGVTPFHIVAFASQSVPSVEEDGDDGLHEFDKILGLNYYADPDVEKWLRWAERDDGKSIFHKGENNRGIGYISPIFVREECLREIRWKPWMAADIGADEEKEKVHKALLYAFLGNGIAQSSAQIQTLAERFNWPMPLVAIGGAKSEDFTFKRDPLEWKRGKGAPDNTPSWKTDDKITTSIDNVCKYFSGEGKPGLDGRFQEEAKKKAREQLAHLLAEIQAFNDNIRPAIGEDEYLKLTDARNGWLRKQFNKASKVDKVYWTKLLEVAEKEEKEVER